MTRSSAAGEASAPLMGLRFLKEQALFPRIRLTVYPIVTGTRVTHASSSTVWGMITGSQA
jgi:hypothetical protein